jgi:hypothetical protein
MVVPKMSTIFSSVGERVLKITFFEIFITMYYLYNQKKFIKRGNTEGVCRTLQMSGAGSKMRL